MNRFAHLPVCFLTLIVCSFNVGAEPDNLQSVDEIRRFAETFVTERLLAPGANDVRALARAGNVDPRLRMSRCAVPLQGLMPATATVAASMTVGVRCTSPAWTVYLPMTVETELSVLVMRGAAARNSSPTADDVELQKRRVPGIATTYLTRVEQLRGYHLKVEVSPGTPLNSGMLAADILIRRGQRVTLVASGSGIEIHMQGEAMADASSTGRVKVMNLSSRKIVEGQVESPDRVRVSL